MSEAARSLPRPGSWASAPAGGAAAGPATVAHPDQAGGPEHAPPTPQQPAEQAPQPQPQPQHGAAATGDAQVDAALAGLGDVRALPLHEQVDRYATIHRQLQDRLADLDG